jgi:hypothetical protein
MSEHRSAISQHPIVGGRCRPSRRPLTDESRHDVIDGILTFEIYANDRLAFGPKRAEYPDQVSFDVSMTDVSRVRLVVRDGDNGEFPCWCGARFE